MRGKIHEIFFNKVVISVLEQRWEMALGAIQSSDFGHLALVDSDKIEEGFYFKRGQPNNNRVRCLSELFQEYQALCSETVSQKQIATKTSF